MWKTNLVLKSWCQDPAEHPTQTQSVCMLYAHATVPPALSCLVRQPLLCVRRRGTQWHFKRNSPVVYLHLHCVSRATAFPFRGWQYPSFLFIALLSGGRKWITGLSRRGTGAITGVWEKRNFDMWGLLTLYFSRTLGVCCRTPQCWTPAAKANGPAGVISSAHLFSSLPPAFSLTFCIWLPPPLFFFHTVCVWLSVLCHFHFNQTFPAAVSQ